MWKKKKKNCMTNKKTNIWSSVSKKKKKKSRTKTVFVSNNFVSKFLENAQYLKIYKFEMFS